MGYTWSANFNASSYGGICVLSHKNVARAEIEGRLKTSEEGKKLLRSPHFIGTIHGFVNEYLALPYMRSQGMPIEVIDSELAQERRWHDLSYGIWSALEKNHLSETNLKYVNTSCELGRLFWGARGRRLKPYRPDQIYQTLSQVSKEPGFVVSGKPPFSSPFLKPLEISSEPGHRFACFSNMPFVRNGSTSRPKSSRPIFSKSRSNCLR